MNGQLQFSASFKLDAQHLVLEYEVRNQGASDAYLLNRLFQSAPEWKMTPDIIYVQFHRPSETIVLSKKIAELPEGKRVTSPVAPFVTPLRAGSSFKEKVQIPLPVKEYLQYPSGTGAEATERRKLTYKFVQFRLGYYWKPEGTTEDVRDISGTEVVMPRTPPGKPLTFGTLETPSTRLDVPVEDLVPVAAPQR